MSTTEKRLSYKRGEPMAPDPKARAPAMTDFIISIDADGHYMNPDFTKETKALLALRGGAELTLDQMAWLLTEDYNEGTTLGIMNRLSGQGLVRHVVDCVEVKDSGGLTDYVIHRFSITGDGKALEEGIRKISPQDFKELEDDVANDMDAYMNYLGFFSYMPLVRAIIASSEMESLTLAQLKDLLEKEPEIKDGNTDTLQLIKDLLDSRYIRVSADGGEARFDPDERGKLYAERLKDDLEVHEKKLEWLRKYPPQPPVFN
jgi:hypothetical protein